MHAFLPAALLAAVLAASAAQARPAGSDLAERQSDAFSPIGPFPLKLDQQYITVRDAELDLTGDEASKAGFLFTPVDSDVYDTHGTIHGWKGFWTETFGVFSLAGDAGRTSAAFGRQLFHLLSGSQWDSPKQDQNFTTDWIPFGTTGETHPDNEGAYGSHKPLNGWRFYPRTSDGVRLQAQPLANGVGTTLQFLNESVY